jgi:hypothetical protein
MTTNARDVEVLAEILYREEHARTSFAHKLAWHREIAQVLFDKGYRRANEPEGQKVRVTFKQ